MSGRWPRTNDGRGGRCGEEAATAARHRDPARAGGAAGPRRRARPRRPRRAHHRRPAGERDGDERDPHAGGGGHVGDAGPHDGPTRPGSRTRSASATSSAPRRWRAAATRCRTTSGVRAPSSASSPSTPASGWRRTTTSRAARRRTRRWSTAATTATAPRAPRSRGRSPTSATSALLDDHDSREGRLQRLLRHLARPDRPQDRPPHRTRADDLAQAHRPREPDRQEGRRDDARRRPLRCVAGQGGRHDDLLRPQRPRTPSRTSRSPPSSPTRRSAASPSRAGT